MSLPTNVDNLADSEFFYEREAEFFGFTPFQFLDAVGEIVVKTVFSMFDRLGSVTLPPQAASFLSSGQIEAGVGQWSAMVENKFGRNYELFEAYVIKNVLMVPDTFVLPHHRDLALVETELATVDIDSELASLAARLQSALTFDAHLDAEEQALREEEDVMSRMEQQLDSLKAKLATSKLGSFEHMTQTLNEHLGSLKSIVLDTIEHSRNLSALEPPIDYDHQDQQWAMTATEQSLDLERELSACTNIATFEDVCTLQTVV